MWIDALFTDKKNDDWGMSLDAVKPQGLPPR